MKIRRDLIIVVLATFCLTSTLFMIVQSRSDSPNWDPWADIKEDGTVDIYDAITLANAYGSNGTTPKNVNVTNFPQQSKLDNDSVHVSWLDPWYYGDYSKWFYCGGYSRIYVYARAVNAASSFINYTFNIECLYVNWATEPVESDANRLQEFTNPLVIAVYVTTITSPLQNETTVRSYPNMLYGNETETEFAVKGPWARFMFLWVGGPKAGWVDLEVTVYLRNE